MRITIIVKTRQATTEILGKGEVWKVSVKSAPIDGKANQELVKFLSKHLKKKVRIVSGLSSRRKVVEIV